MGVTVQNKVAPFYGLRRNVLTAHEHMNNNLVSLPEK